MELLDDICHGEGFAGPGDAEEYLSASAIEHAAAEFFDSAGLVACRTELAGELKRLDEFVHGPCIPCLSDLPLWGLRENGALLILVDWTAEATGGAAETRERCCAGFSWRAWVRDFEPI